MSDLENEDDFGTRRRQAIFGDDGDDEDNQGDEDEDNQEDEKEARVYTEAELGAERRDLLGRKVYTEDSIEDFISALEDGVEYNEATETYLKLMPDEPDESEDESEPVRETTEEQDLDAEFPTMAKDLANREKSSSEDEFPELTKEMNKKKKTVGTGTLDDEFPSMKDLPK